MKNIVVFLFVSFILVGCSTKDYDIEIKMPDKDKEVKVVKPNDILGEKIQGEEVIEDEEILKIEENINLLNEENQEFQIAFIYPSKIVSKYAKPAISTILGYFSYRNIDYKLKVIDSKDENITNIQMALNEVRELGIKNVIALFTPNILEELQSIDLSSMKVYLPLIEKGYISNNNLIFGSISYEEQIKKLLEYSYEDDYSMFYQNSFLGRKLKTILDNNGVYFKIQKEIVKNRNNFKSLVKDYRLNGTTLFLNTDIVKSSLLLSQISVYEVKPKFIVGTQIAYDPLLISLTQSKDRENFIIANSIEDVDISLEDEIALFGANITYEWVDYSILVGVNYLYDSNEAEVVRTNVLDNQAVYMPSLYKSTDYGFELLSNF